MAFFELVGGHLLVPSGMTPAAARLYKLMHYGQNPGLATMMVLMATAAAAVSLVAYLIWRLAAARIRAPRASRLRAGSSRER